MVYMAPCFKELLPFVNDNSLFIRYHLFQDIFEICGGDRSSGLTWHNLKTAYLGFNGLEKLDTSLVCTP